MADVCRGGTLAPPSGEWTVFTNEDRAACQNSGGSVVSSGSGCGATSVSRSSQGPGGSSELAEAAVSPLRSIRDGLAAAELVQDLDRLNREASGEIEAMLEDPEVAVRLAAAVGMVSQFATGMLRDDENAAELRYTESVHRELAELARELQQRLPAELSDTVDRIIGSAEGLVGSSGAEIREVLGGDRSTSA